MYKCEHCGCTFYEPRIIETTYEYYYGVSNEFSNSTPLTLEVCPSCESESIDEFDEDEEEDE